MKLSLSFPTDFDFAWVDDPDVAKFCITAMHQSDKISREITFNYNHRADYSRQYYDFFLDMREKNRIKAVKKMAHDAIRLPWVRRK